MVDLLIAFSISLAKSSRNKPIDLNQSHHDLLRFLTLSQNHGIMELSLPVAMCFHKNCIMVSAFLFGTKQKHI